MAIMQPGCSNLDREAASSVGVKQMGCRKVNGGNPAGGEGEKQMFSSENCRHINIRCTPDDHCSTCAYCDPE